MCSTQVMVDLGIVIIWMAQWKKWDYNETDWRVSVNTSKQSLTMEINLVCSQRHIFGFFAWVTERYEGSLLCWNITDTKWLSNLKWSTTFLLATWIYQMSIFWICGIDRTHQITVDLETTIWLKSGRGSYFAKTILWTFLMFFGATTSFWSTSKWNCLNPTIFKRSLTKTTVPCEQIIG